MNCPGLARIVFFFSVALHILSSGTVNAAAQGVDVLLQKLDEYPHTRQVAFTKEEVIDHEIGLGAIQKVRGEWHFKHSERLSGTLISYTWLIGNGFSSAEMMEELLESVAQLEGATKLFACDGRACGRAVQWANRVFHQRLLFGREDFQRYRVFGLEGEQPVRLIAYSAERTADRQYLHVELLLIAQ